MSEFLDRTTHHPPTSIARRMALCIRQQPKRNPSCPDHRIDGRVALVTGGGRGIGLETSRGLARRGAEVVMASRGAEAGGRAAAALAEEAGRPAWHLPLDLGDLASIEVALDLLAERLDGRRLDILVANAGLWPQRFRRSEQGHELAFATNVLGHHALLREARSRGLVADGERIVMLTGDIYIMSRACTADYRFRTPLGGQLAYCRSKLGNLWLAQEWTRHAPDWNVQAVHPGVIASGLGGGGAPVRAIKRTMLLSVEAGAQTSLFCATQPGLESGGYWHNTLGRVELAPDDPGADTAAAKQLWEEVERLARS